MLLVNSDLNRENVTKKEKKLRAAQPPLVANPGGLKLMFCKDLPMYVQKAGTVTWTETFNCDICGKQKGSVDHW